MNPTSLIMIILMVVAFYFLIMRPQKKRQQAIQQTLGSLVPGSRVLLGSGLFGTIVSIGERQAVLEISPGVHLTVLKQAIVRTVTDADEDAPAEEADDLGAPVVADRVTPAEAATPGDATSDSEPHPVTPPARDGATALGERPAAGADPGRLA